MSPLVLLALSLLPGAGQTPATAPPPRAVPVPELIAPPRAVPVPPKPVPPPPPLPNGLVTLRSLGPAFTSGRVVGFAVHPTDRAHYYVAVASGGVWKTVNAGTTWTPVFDKEGSYSIGCVTLDPKNPNTVWVGTGENNSQRSVAYGDGVYKSTNGGASWANVGLKASEHIAKIMIDPRNSDVVYVAAQGPLWGPGGDRGLYKTTDGGKAWEKVLGIDEHTGVTDFTLDPRNPDVIVAASYQRRRHVYTIVNGGPGSAIHRSTDAGKTWKKVTAGLPGVDLGRIGLAMAPSAPDTLYATVEAAEGQGGVFRSTDGGATWQKRNPFDSQGQYYSHPVVDPVNKDRIYVMNVFIQVSDDGGSTLRSLGESWKHVDNHEIWIDPKDPKYYLVGCDGGIYESFDRGANWHFKSNLPVTQFYDVGVDQNPASGPFYHVYGGTQDNFTFGGPVRTRSATGVANSDWYVVLGGDGFHVKVDPTDPNTVYAEYQHGGLARFDRRTGTRIDIRPMTAPNEPALRWNWDSALMISPHDPKRLYFAANRVFRTDDRGDSWKVISPDLTRQLDRDALPVFGKVQRPEAVFKHGSTSFYGNIVALAESLKTEGLILAGTDDGLIQVLDNSGPGWRKIDKFPGVPERTYVSKLVASQHGAGTFFAAFDNHKNADFKPYLLKTTDAGRTWTSLVGNLPERGTVYCVAEDHVNPDLLFCGTEFGLFVTLDGGKVWHPLKDGLPTIQVKDLVIQKHNNDLVIGTFGRGFYVIDDYTPLRQFKPELLQKDAHLFAPEDALLYAQSSPLGGFGKGEQGASYYTADNPPFGATFLVHVKDAPKSLRDQRKDAEQKAAKDKKDPPYPSAEALRAEAEEESASTRLTITDADGAVVSTLTVPNGAGLHRVTWGLREAGGGVAVPGTYKATLTRRVAGKLTPLGDPVECKVLPDPLVGLKPEDYKAIADHNKKVRVLQRAVTQTTGTASGIMERLEFIRGALEQTAKPDEAAKQKVRELIAQLKLVQRNLTGDSFLASRNENTPESIGDVARYAAFANRGAIHPPTGTQNQAIANATAHLIIEIAKLKQLQEKDVPELEKVLEALGGPLPPGKLPAIGK